MNTAFRSMFLLALLLAVSFESRAEEWIHAHGRSCAVVCEDEHMRPVVSGIYEKNKNPFYVCRTDLGDEGKRAGYNLEPAWHDVCVAGFYGREEKGPHYDCLCRESR